MTLMICFFKEHTPRIFEPCYSTKEAEMSTGLFALFRNKTMKILKVVLSLFLYISFISNLQAKSLENISIQLKWFNQYQFAGIYIAKEKGFYEEEGLNVEIKERDPKKNNVLQVIEGESEYGVAESVILRYRAEGHKVKVIATIFQHNALVLISKKGSGILSPYEMKGKKIAFQEGLDDSIISGLLTFAHMGTNEYIKMPLDYSYMDFVNDKVDITEAYISDQPYWLKEKYGIDVNIIDPKNYGMNFYGDLIFTTEEEAEKHPLRVKKFKEATLRGWKYALEHQDEAIKIILDKYNTRDLKYEQLQYEARITKNLIASDYIPLGNVRKERFRMLTELYQGKGISSAELHKAVDTIIYNPDVKENVFFEYLYYIIAIAVSLLLLILFLFFNNRRLKYLVREQTKELFEAKEFAEQASLSKSNFLANMSHEIRTPMNGLLGFVDRLKKTEEDPQRIKQFEIIRSSGETLMNIINDILDFSKIESGKMEIEYSPLPLRKFFEEVPQIFQQIASAKNINILNAINENIPESILGDKTRLKQVVFNLMSNALKFTHDGGNVTLQAYYKEKLLHVAVIDTGIGIAKENQKKIFEAFSQEDASITRKFGGTGLGLSISLRLINLMGGEIKLESEVGKGSKFYFDIPVDVCSIKVDESSIEENGDTQIQGHVLIVEDNKTNQMLLGMLLDDYGITYDIANDGAEGVLKFKQTKYDAILMDENMPIMNGIEATKIIREDYESDIPIIAVTANALTQDRERFLEAGMNDYISKPYTEEDIFKVLRKYLG